MLAEEISQAAPLDLTSLVRWETLSFKQRFQDIYHGNIEELSNIDVLALRLKQSQDTANQIIDGCFQPVLDAADEFPTSQRQIDLIRSDMHASAKGSAGRILRVTLDAFVNGLALISDHHTTRRGLALFLYVVAYHREQGTLPHTLEEAIPSELHDELLDERGRRFTYTINPLHFEIRHPGIDQRFDESHDTDDVVYSSVLPDM